jgi:hypothetical protein
MEVFMRSNDRRSSSFLLLGLTIFGSAICHTTSAEARHVKVNGACGPSNGQTLVSAPTSGLCSSGTASAVTGSGPWFWSCAGSNDGTTADCEANIQSSGGSGSTTNIHYAPNGNFSSSGSYLPGPYGFNLADVSSVATLNSLPVGVKGLVWLGLCKGANSAFVNAVTPFIGNANLYGFYLMDEPYPTICAGSNLQAVTAWIHANVPGAKVFVVLYNEGTDEAPYFDQQYGPSHTGIDLYGLDPYPIQPQFSGGADYNIIPARVTAAKAIGVTEPQMIPVYQAFGGGGYSSYTLPTAAQEQAILSTWAALLPDPPFDYAYSWGVQDSDSAISNTPYLQQVFLQWNTAQ